MKSQINKAQNMTERLYLAAENNPDKVALINYDGHKITFSELILRINNYRLSFIEKEIKASDRVLILQPFDENFIYFIFALMAENIIPVLIDPRLEKKFWKKIVQESQVKLIFTNKRIKKFRFFLPWMNQYPLLTQEDFNYSFKNNLLKIQKTDPTDDVLITLTSGTTGYPKIIARKFSVLEKQQYLIKKYISGQDTDIHLALHGIGALQSLIQGETTVILPQKKQTPRIIYNLLKNFQVTRFSAPPGLINDLMKYICSKKIEKLSSLKSILTGGAPIPRWFVNESKNTFPNSNLTILYGSNECEPISLISGDEILKNTNPGYPIGNLITELSTVEEITSKIKALNITGPNCVTDSTGIFHTGDLVYFKDNCLYLLGRETEKLNNIPSALIEEPLERFPYISRVAALFIHETLIIHVEPKNNLFNLKEFQNHALEICSPFNFTQIKFRENKKIPVDSRHRWKIQKKKLI